MEPLARAAVAIGLDALFLETHPDHSKENEALLLVGDGLMAGGKVEAGMEAFARITPDEPRFFEEAWFKTGKALRLQEKIADELQVPVGTYTHRSNSMHCYVKDFDMLENFASSVRGKPVEDITYEYEGFYKEMMEESIPAIMEQVRKLKKKMK